MKTIIVSPVSAFVVTNQLTCYMACPLLRPPIAYIDYTHRWLHVQVYPHSESFCHKLLWSHREIIHVHG